jgi:hypothetical protein
MKRCLASANVGPAVLVRIPPDFIDLTRKLKANVGAAHGYVLGTADDVNKTEHIALVGAEELEEDHPPLQLGRGQDVPLYKTAAKQQRINDDVSLHNAKIEDWSRIHNSSQF